MKGLVKWLLIPTLLAAGLLLVTADQAEAARVWVGVGYPGYYAPYPYAAYSPGYYPAYYPAYYRAPPVYWGPPAVRFYRPAMMVPGPMYGPPCGCY